MTPPAVYPVIQVADERQAIGQARIAFEQAVAGVFLIDHDRDVERLVSCIAAVRAAHPDRFLGANLIRTSPAQALTTLAEAFGGPVPLDALWTDDARLSTDPALPPGDGLSDARARTGWTGQHFGGVAFKYQTPVPDSALAALGALAREQVDVPTTSGPGTGLSIAVERLQLLRRGLGDHPLALASGVTPENAALVAPLVDHILVSTGISGTDGIDPGKLTLLLDALDRSSGNT